jgi:L,D-peptidoglycan transpeptidase YkuD (ErfK/YbiS/YcfS/YnhG family)
MKRLAWPLTGLLVVAVAAAGCTSTKHASARGISSASPASALSSTATSPAPGLNLASPLASPPSVPDPTSQSTAPTSAQATTAQATTVHATTSAPVANPDPKSSTKPPVAPPPKPKPTTPAPQPKPPAPLLVEQLADVGNARQVVIVTSSSWTTDVATLQTFEKGTTGWRPVFPAMAAHIGRAGFSADKHEGDLKTPAGKYGFGTMFGQRANPGVKFPYRQADSQSVWVDDVKSPYYNTWQENAALSGEHLASSAYATAYAYAAAIAYNVNPIVKGKGSAIFLHVSTGGGTAGCVSVAQSNLLQVLRWLDPAKAPIIVMGPTSVIRQY